MQSNTVSLGNANVAMAVNQRSIFYFTKMSGVSQHLANNSSKILTTHGANAAVVGSNASGLALGIQDGSKMANFGGQQPRESTLKMCVAGANVASIHANGATGQSNAPRGGIPSMMMNKIPGPFFRPSGSSATGPFSLPPHDSKQQKYSTTQIYDQRNPNPPVPVGMLNRANMNTFAGLNPYPPFKFVSRTAGVRMAANVNSDSLDEQSSLNKNQKLKDQSLSRSSNLVMNASTSLTTISEKRVIKFKKSKFIVVRPLKSQKGETQNFIKRNEDGHLMVEDLTVKDIQNSTGHSPFYLTSKSQLTANFNAYKNALEGLDSAFIGYALKVNHNMNVLRYLAGLGCGAMLESGKELQIAIKAGFDTEKMVFNGIGKLQEELELAVEKGILVNIDNEVDLDNIIQAGKNTGKKARAMLKMDIHPVVDPKVNKYVTTGMTYSESKIVKTKNKSLFDKIRSNSDHIEILGAHYHFGSTVKDVTVFKREADQMKEVIEYIRKEGFNLEYLNLGGGLGIDYEKNGEQILTPNDLVDSVRQEVKQMNLKLIIEPDHSMVGNTTLFVNKVVGVVASSINIIVTDGSMSELIRPSLYDTYQKIEIAEPCEGDVKTFDVVGHRKHLYLSDEFLGFVRKLPTPHEGASLVVYDSGAYCQASEYKMKLTCAEFWVDGNQLFQVRREPQLDDYLSIFDNKPLKIDMNK